MKYRRVLVSGQIIVAIMTTGKHPSIRVNGLPEGAKFQYSYPGDHFGIWIVVSHDSFDQLKDGDIIPEHPRPEIEKL